MTEQQVVTCRVNWEVTTLAGRLGDPASRALRELQIFSVRETCGIGLCGTCTVLLDGQPVSTCILPLYALEGKEVLTAEGLGIGDNLTDIQMAFIQYQAFQCSFCTPGFILSAHALLDRVDDHLDEDDVVRGLSGHLCRCGCYPSIKEAVVACARERGILTPGNNS